MAELFPEGIDGIRSNQLLKLVKETIDPKIAGPTLYRHLRYLQKGKIVKRIKKGKQNITYLLNSNSPLLSEKELELPKKWLTENEERMKLLNLNEIVDCILILTRIHALETTKLQLEMYFSDEKSELIKFKNQLINSFFRNYFILLFNAIKEKGSEYEKVKNLLEKEIESMKSEFFEMRQYQ